MQYKLRELLILSGILLLGFILRVFYLYEIKDNPDFYNPILDASFHHYWAKGLATGNWSVPESHNDPLIQSIPYIKFPGYPYFLAFFYWLFGPGHLIPRIVQIGVGMLNCILAFLIGKKWFGSAVGLIFSAFMSSYWIFIYFEGELYAPILLVFTALFLIYTLAIWTEKTSFMHFAIGGFALGTFALVRANILLFVPVVIAWLAWILSRRKILFKLPIGVLGFMLGMALAVSPATIRNYITGNEPVLISTNGGLNLFIGNNEFSDGITPEIPGLKQMAGIDSWTPFDYPLIVRSLNSKLGKHLNYNEASSYWISEAVHYIKTHPWEFITLTLKKAVLFWSPREIANPTEVYYDRMHSNILRNIPGNFSVILSLSITGIILFFLNLKKPLRDRETYSPPPKIQLEVTVLILLFIFIYFVSFLPFLISARFRVPIIPFLFLFGSYGLYHIGRYIYVRNFRNAVAWLSFMIILYAASNINFINHESDLAQWRYYRGLTFLKSGQTDNAIREYLEAIRIKPDFPEAHNHLGASLYKQGKQDEAISLYKKALLINPDYLDAHNNLGVALAAQGKYGEAITHYTRALRVKSDDEEAYYNLGLALAAQRKLDEAIAHYTKALLIKPDYAEAHHILGVTLAELGKYDEAITYYTRALRIKPDYAEAHNNLGIVLAKQGNLTEAITHFMEALRIKPNYADARNNLGLAKALLKQK